MSAEKPNYLGHRARIKEKFLKNLGKDFHDYELLEILLFSGQTRKDVKPIAKNLLKKFGNLENVINADLDLLKSIPGINESSIVAVKIIKEIMNRSLKNKISGQMMIESWQDLLDYCKVSMSYNKKEQLKILFLDRKFRLISDEVEVNGSVENIIIDIREIVKKALLLAASSVILIHNHPSGDVNPSKADIENTTRIVNALKAVNIKVHDHLIIGENEYYSFKKKGLV